MTASQLIGQLVGDRYRILNTLGKGGQGETYLAVDTHLPGQSKRAIKHLQSARKDKETLRTARVMFEREAAVLEKIGQNPRIPQLFDYFQVECQFYLVQEFVEGETLGSQFRMGKIWTESEVIDLLEDVLNTLKFVHSEGVLHRDLKPDNLILRPDGTMNVIDFGSVKFCVARAQQTKSDKNTTIAIGTLGYMPVEQALGKPVAASDLFALGAIAVQALTGVHPRDLPKGEDGELLWRDKAEISDGLAAYLSTLVRQHHTERFQNATEALQHLHQLHGRDAGRSLNSKKDETVTVILPSDVSEPVLTESPSPNELTHSSPSTPPIVSAPAKNPIWMRVGLGAIAVAGLAIGGWGVMQMQQSQRSVSTAQTILEEMQQAVAEQRFGDCVEMAEAMLTLDDVVPMSAATTAEMNGLLKVCRLRLPDAEP